MLVRSIKEKQKDRKSRKQSVYTRRHLQCAAVTARPGMQGLVLLFSPLGCIPSRARIGIFSTLGPTSATQLSLRRR